METRGIEDSGRLIDATTSSLELHLVAPLVAGDDWSTNSPDLFPRGTTMVALLQHRRIGIGTGERQGKTSPVSLRASLSALSRPLLLRTEGARSRPHLPLNKARHGNKRSARASVLEANKTVRYCKVFKMRLGFDFWYNVDKECPAWHRDRILSHVYPRRILSIEGASWLPPTCPTSPRRTIDLGEMRL